jgi:hypothetical protein
MREGFISDMPAGSPVPVLVDKDVAHWGMASLLMGGFLSMGAGLALIFTLVWWKIGPQGIDIPFAFLGCVLGLITAAAGSVTSIIFGMRGWQQSAAQQRNAALGIAGTLTSFVALGLWIAVGIALLDMLFYFMKSR